MVGVREGRRRLLQRHALTRARAIVITIALVSLAAGACSPDDDAAAAGHTWAVPSDDTIAKLLADRLRHNGVGMVVGVIDGDRRSVVAYGRSGARNGRPLDGSTVFQIGSLTKVITSLLLAELTLRGEVNLDDPVDALLPSEATLREVERPVTLRDLATHTSGLPSMPTNFDIRGEPDPYAAYTVEQLWAFLSAFEPPRPPGARYEYSNLGVSLLGRALALKLGTTYETLVSTRVLAPLEMTSTSITLTADQRERLAPGHDPYLQPIEGWEMATLQASGSLRSTVEDMLKLLDAYLGRAKDGRLNQAAALQLREGVQLDGALHPLGIVRRADGVFRHAGGKEGYRSGLAINPQAGTAAIVLANTRTYADEPMALALHLVTGDALPLATRAPTDKPRLSPSAADLRHLEGRYRDDEGRTFDVAAVAGRLRIRYPNSSIFEFVPAGPRDFFYSAGNDDVTFDVDPEGRGLTLTVYGDGKAAGNGRPAHRMP